MTGSSRKRILVVGQGEANARLLAQAVNEIGAEFVHADSEEALTSRLAEREPVHLAVVEIAVFFPGAWRRLRLLQQKAMPFIVIAPQREQWVTTRLFEYGACCVLQKPAAKRAVLSALGNLSDLCA